MNWDKIVNEIKPYIVKIKTPEGYGTGFLCLYNSDKSMCGIATAYHVINNAHEWNEPIKILLETSKTTELFLEKDERVIISDKNIDSAIILFPTSKIPQLPNELIKLRTIDQNLDIGSEVGWVGYPYLEENNICFFSGCISARNENGKYYMIDGVAINGVSGGPVFYSTETKGIEIIGIISAYMANRASGTSLPGLSIAQDVFHLQKVATTIKSIDDERNKKQEITKKEDRNAITTTPNP